MRNLACVALAAMLIFCGATAAVADDIVMDLVDQNGIGWKSIEAVETGDSLSVGFSGLKPGEGLDVFLNDNLGNEWSFMRIYADHQGNIEPTLFWYHTGVIGTTLADTDFRPEPAFDTFDQAEDYFLAHPLTLSVTKPAGSLISPVSLEKAGRLARWAVPFKKRTRPLLYPSNRQGVLVNAFDLAQEDVYLTGRGYTPGSLVRLYTVANQDHWAIGDPLIDVSGKVEEVRVSADGTFRALVWGRESMQPGSYDFVAEVIPDSDALMTQAALAQPVLSAASTVSYGYDTGAVIYLVGTGGHISLEVAGRAKPHPGKFEFSDAFEKGEDVWAAVDPTDVPPTHTGGSYAAYFVVNHRPTTYWDGFAPALTDVTGNVEIHRVKYWCINLTRRLVWPSATQTAPIRGYDVIVDFGAVPATTSAQYVFDNTYNIGTDFIDGYGPEGFWVYEDPGSQGNFPVGIVDWDDPNAITGLNVTSGTGSYPVNMAWARIMYPATSAGTQTPVNTNLSNYPVALFLHGRHWSCDSDGPGPGLVGSFEFPQSIFPGSPICPLANRIPSHLGYDYIMERLASQGIISISINAHEIQWDPGAFNYDARGRLVLWYLDRMRDWNHLGNDPWNGLFQGKIDMNRIALSGHSRGGEGVVAAQQFNLFTASPHSIVAVNAIAPTDQNPFGGMPPYAMTDAPYFLLLGARDGDVSNHQGYRTYDRAYPQGTTVRYPKAIAWVYGANHNYFNTIWTDTASLGSPNPWAGSLDDAFFFQINPMPAAEQRQIALSTVAAFFRRHLQGIEPYKEILTARVQPSAMNNSRVYWTYQDDQRMAIDDFEQQPFAPSTNSLGGTVTTAGFFPVQEIVLRNSTSSIYPLTLPSDVRFFHDTIGLTLSWASGQTYVSELPIGRRDISAYSHLTLRVAKAITGVVGTGPDLRLFINIEDSSGNKALWDIPSDQFDSIPHPYERSSTSFAQLLTTGVRIPLRTFTANNSGVDLTDIARITVRTEGTGELGLDDLEVGN